MIGTDLIAIDIISAFTPSSLAEDFLFDLLKSSEVCINSYGSLLEWLPGNNGSHFPILFIIPILGENDLLASHYEQLKTLAQHPIFLGKPIIFVLQGDRHVWDDFDFSYPVYAKLKSIFFYSNVIHICPEKLDIDSVSLVAQYVLTSVDAKQYPYELQVASIARLLNNRPRWDAQKKNLGFYDDKTGISLLTDAPLYVIDAVLATIQEMELNALELNHAMFRIEHLSSYCFKSRNINLVGNNLDFSSIWNSLSGVEWINMAANNLSVVDASQCQATITHLYLHKNSIHSFNLPAGLHCKLKEISLYRNCLHEFDFPADQTELVKLNLGANPITRIPETLKNATNLRFLGIARTCLHSLPDWLYDMKNLRELDISHMKNSIPRQQIQELASRGVKIILEPGRESYEVSI